MSDEPKAGTEVAMTLTMEDFSRRLLAKSILNRDVLLSYVFDSPPTQRDIDAMNERGARRETVNLPELPSKLPGVIAVLSEALDKVPEAYRDTAEFDIYADRDGDVDVSVTYQRPETDEEWAKRRADVERRQKLAEEQQAKRDRAEYERLRVKFNTPEER